MDRILIIGYGNPSRVDDGIGFHAAERLQASNRCSDVDVVADRELRFDVVEPASRARLVIFINSVTVGKPGAVWEREIDPPEHTNGVCNCELTPPLVLAAAKIIYKRCPPAILISVTGENFGFDRQLSPTGEAALSKVVDRLNQIVTSASGQAEEVIRRRAA